MLVPVGGFSQQLTIIHKTKDEKVVQKPIMSVMFGKL